MAGFVVHIMFCFVIGQIMVEVKWQCVICIYTV